MTQCSTVLLVMGSQALDELQILDPIVRLALIDVMDDATRRYRTITLFPDPSMFQYALPAGQRQPNVALCSDATIAACRSLQFVLVLVEALARTELDTGSGVLEWLPTVATKSFRPISSTFRTHTT